MYFFKGSEEAIIPPSEDVRPEDLPGSSSSEPSCSSTPCCSSAPCCPSSPLPEQDQNSVTRNKLGKYFNSI